MGQCCALKNTADRHKQASQVTPKTLHHFERKKRNLTCTQPGDDSSRLVLKCNSTNLNLKQPVSILKAKSIDSGPVVTKMKSVTIQNAYPLVFSESTHERSQDFTIAVRPAKQNLLAIVRGHRDSPAKCVTIPSSEREYQRSAREIFENGYI